MRETAPSGGMAGRRTRGPREAVRLVAPRSDRDARRVAVVRGLERAVAKASAWAPVVPRFSLLKLRTLAADDYNDRLLDRMERRQDWSGRLAGLDSDPEFLARLCVNYLRHRMTSYDAQLRRLGRLGRPGDLVVATVQRNALEAIQVAYPELAAECARQMERKGLVRPV